MGKRKVVLKARLKKGGTTTRRKKPRHELEEEEARATFFGQGEALDDEEISSEESQVGSDTHPEGVLEEAIPPKESIEAVRLRLAREYLEETKRRVEDSDDEEEVAAALAEAREEKQHQIADDVEVASKFALKLKGHRGAITCMTLTSSSAFSGSKDNSVVEFDLETGVQKRRYIERWPQRAEGEIEVARCNESEGSLAPRQAHEAEILAIAASETTVAIGGRDKLIHIWDARSPAPLRSLRGHSKDVTGLAFGDDGNLFSTSEDGSVKVWRDALAHSETLLGHGGPVRCIDLFQRPLTGGADSCLRSWKLKDETHLVYRSLAGSSVDACFTLNSDHFISGGDDGHLSFWNTKRKKPITQLKAPHGGPLTHPNWLTAVGGFANSDLVASGSLDGHVCLFKTPNLGAVAHISVDGVVNAIQSTSDFRHIAVAASHEHKFGRWFRVPQAANAILLYAVRTHSSQASPNT